MKTYDIELKRTSFINYTIEADNKEEATELALAQGGEDYPGNADWQVRSCVVEKK